MVDSSESALPINIAGVELICALETGALFQLITTLMISHSQTVQDSASLENFCLLLGRLFQIRDDYQNLVSADVSLLYFQFPFIHPFRNS